MNERTQQPWTSEPFEMRARLTQPAPDALDAADGETATNQSVQPEAVGDDVPPRLLPWEV